MANEFTADIASRISEVLGIDIDESMIEVPPDTNMGDYAFPCFSLAKDMKKSPIQIAQDIAAKISSDKYISSVKQIGPYVNFFVKKEELSKKVLTEIFMKGKDYGKNQIKERTLMLEGWQPNTHKAFHIGHIRNAVLSESLARLLEFYGYKVIRTSYMGDVGAHVAKWIWYFKKFYKGDIPDENVSRWAGNIYTDATIKLKDNPDLKDEVHEVHKKLEDGDPELVDVWEKTRELCLEDFWKIFEELDCSIERHYYESEVEQPGIEIVKKMADKGIAEYSDGAIIINLEEYGLGIFVLLKSNGASLYSTKDIALAQKKSEEYDFDQSLYIVASEQDHHFRQLFKTLEIMGYKHADKLKHVSYGMVKLQEGKMSSRLGNIILYEDFRDQLMSKVDVLLKDRDISKKDKEDISKKVAFGAMKFSMLNQDSVKDIIFSFSQALSFDGETGPYVQYTHARCSSILKRHGKKVSKDIDFSLLKTVEEKNILRLLEDFPENVEKAAMNYKPNTVTRHVLDLCQAFNEYYHKHKIIQEDKALEKARILLVDCVRTVIRLSLDILSMEAPDVM